MPKLKLLDHLIGISVEIKFIQTISMVSLTKDDYVKISEFQICLRMDCCHFNHDTDTLGCLKYQMLL